MKEKLGLPVRFVGVGEGMDDLMPFDAGGLCGRAVFARNLTPRNEIFIFEV